MSSRIQTYTGRYIDIFSPKEEDIDIHDIARGLAMKPRWSGHINYFFSIAQHSILVSSIVPKEHQKWALLHDAAESYIADVPRPIKKRLPLYKQAEKKLLKTIMARFGLGPNMPTVVKKADDIVLVNEAKALMDEDGPLLQRLADNYGEVPTISLGTMMSWREAEAAFLNRFYSLWGRDV